MSNEKMFFTSLPAVSLSHFCFFFFFCSCLVGAHFLFIDWKKCSLADKREEWKAWDLFGCNWDSEGEQSFEEELWAKTGYISSAAGPVG